MALHPPNRPRRPQHPPHATGGKPPILDTGGRQPRGSRVDRQKAIQRAIGNVRNSFIEQGVDPALALRYAKVILSRPGVVIGSGAKGNIQYKGQAYAPDAFARSGLADILTGKASELKNEQVLQGDPGYLQAIAQLGLARDQATAGLSDQQRQALIQFGDPSFITDPTLKAQASANPFSDTRLLDAAYQNQQSATRNAANRSGVYQGGGLTSGLGEDQRVYAAQNQDAVTKLQALLQSINQQQAMAQQSYGIGQGQAYQDAYQALLASGAIKAAHAPRWGVGNFSVRGYGKRPNVGGGGGAGRGAGPSAPQQPPRGQYPTQTTYPGGPIIYQGGGNQFGVPPPRGPTQTTYPAPLYDAAALQRRYGING